MEELRILQSMAQVDFSELFRVYGESLLCHARRDYPHMDPDVAMEREQQAFLDDCRCFFRDRGRYYVLVSAGRYLSIACAEDYEDGSLISALETAPDCRRKGYGRKLLAAVTAGEQGRLYSHVAKTNKASLCLHEACGFHILKDSARLIDGTVSGRFYTMIINENKP